MINKNYLMITGVLFNLYTSFLVEFSRNNLIAQLLLGLHPKAIYDLFVLFHHVYCWPNLLLAMQV